MDSDRESLRRGIVDGGFIGLVRALLSPVEMEAASSVLDQFGLDGDQAGWWLLAAGLLTHQVRGRASGLKTRGLEDPAIEQRGTQSAADELAASRRAAISDEGVGAAGREAAVTHADPAVEPEDVAAVGRRDQPVIPTPRFPANENAMIRGTAAAANENRLAGPSIAELEAFAANGEAANLVASEIAELEWQLAQQEAEELAQQEGAELGERAVASGRGGGRGNTGSSADARSTTFSRSTGGRATGGPRPGAKPPATPRGTGRTVLDTTKAKIRGLDAKTRQWLEDIAAEWRKQCARFKKDPGLNASQRGIKAHAATQRAMKELHPGTVIEEPTGVGSSGVPRKSDLAQGPGVGRAAVAELKPWGYKLPGSGGLATSRAAIESGVETLQLQAYGALDRELGRPVFVFTANGNVWTPAPGGRWTLVGKAR